MIVGLSEGRLAGGVELALDASEIAHAAPCGRSSGSGQMRVSSGTRWAFP